MTRHCRMRLRELSMYPPALDGSCLFRCPPLDFLPSLVVGPIVFRLVVSRLAVFGVGAIAANYDRMGRSIDVHNLSPVLRHLSFAQIDLAERGSRI